MNITARCASGRGRSSCTRNIAQLLTARLLGEGTLYEFQLPEAMPHVCRGLPRLHRRETGGL